MDSESQRILGERNPDDVLHVGSASHEEKLRYLKTADIFCSPAMLVQLRVVMTEILLDPPTNTEELYLAGWGSVVTRMRVGGLRPLGS